MPLKGIPAHISPELLYALSKMGHGDRIVVSDRNFPSDSVAAHTVTKVPIRVFGSTAEVLKDILKLIPLDPYCNTPVCVMDRVESDKARDLAVPAYDQIGNVVTGETYSGHPYGPATFPLIHLERSEFYEAAKAAYCIVQTTDHSPYANVIISKGVL